MCVWCVGGWVGAGVGRGLEAAETHMHGLLTQCAPTLQGRLWGRGHSHIRPLPLLCLPAARWRSAREWVRRDWLAPWMWQSCLDARCMSCCAGTD